MEILTVSIIDNGQRGHDDLLFSIPDLIGDREFDSYYFWLAIEPAETTADLKYAVSELLCYWHDKVEESENGDIIFLPIDFSDQYTGCLKVQNSDDELVLTFGFSRRAGWAVSPIDPGNYFREVNDFEADSDKQISVDRVTFISALDRQIKKLRT
jgi:hypothetical protein